MLVAKIANGLPGISFTENNLVVYLDEHISYTRRYDIKDTDNYFSLSLPLYLSSATIRKRREKQTKLNLRFLFVNGIRKFS